MKRVLFISYHFPPIGGAGVQRPTKIVKYLPRVGYEPVVIAGEGKRRGLWTPVDETLTRQIPDSVEVHRVPGPEPPSMDTGWRRPLERWFRLRSRFSKWWVNGVVELGRLAGTSVDVICTSMGPYESAEAGAALARELEKPWVADLRDPWALDEVLVFPTGLHRRRELLKMRRLLTTASAIVMNTPEAARRLREAFPRLAAARVFVITNGFDPDDFAESPARSESSVFKIAHTGYLHTNLGRKHRRTARLRRALGGDPGRVDILARSHVYLLDAVNRLLTRRPELQQVLQVHLAGVLTGADLEVAEHAAGVVRTHGYLPRSKAVELMRSADLLFLPLHGLPEGTRATITPGKTYDYLASGKPILAALPDGDARDLLQEAGHALLCRPADATALERLIEEQIDRWAAGIQSREPRPEVVERYSYRRLSAALGEVFDDLVERREATRTDPALVGRSP